MAYTEIMISQIPEIEFFKKMLGLIGKTHLNAGNKFDKDQVNLTINDLCIEFIKYYGFLSFSEIEIAFKNGLKKEYGEYYGLCNVTYFDWVKGYYQCGIRMKALNAIEDAKLELKPKETYSEQEKELIIINGAKQKFNEFKSGIEISDCGNVSYNYLVRRGLINFTVERKNQIKETTIIEMKSRITFDKSRTEKVGDAINKALTKDAIICNSKKNALKEFFRDLIEMGKELEL